MKCPGELIGMKKDSIILIVVLILASFEPISRITTRTIRAAGSEPALKNLVANDLFLLESRTD